MNNRVEKNNHVEKTTQLGAADNYNYDLPKELIADKPAEPRDASRLFVYDTARDIIALDTFANIAKYIPAQSLLVLNDTKVVPARLELQKKTGGKVITLFLFNEWDRGATIKGLPDRGVNIGDILFAERSVVGRQSTAEGRPIVEVVSHDREEFTFKLLVSAGEFEKLCEEKGRTPLPPYIHSDMNEGEVRNRYQTTFAAKPASVAAPTASLHFTPAVFKSLEEKGVTRAEVTLHVGRGTFSPVTEANSTSGHLHSEPIAVSGEAAQQIAEAKRAGRTVIVAGTTSLRVLESTAAEILTGKSFMGETSIFIQPPYDFRVADALITNFHLPGTSLLMLLDAFLQHKGAKQSWKSLYVRAIAEKFHFYSFGDAMLVI